MENKMALADISELLCLVCNTNLDLNSCTNIFYVSLPHNGEILANFVLKVLKLSTSDLRSSHVCLRCYNLFGMLEQAQWTVANIQCEIFKIFQSSINEKLSVNSSANTIPKNHKISENFSGTENPDQVNESKIIINDHLIEKDITLHNITNQVINNSETSNNVENKHNKPCVIINDNECKPINYTSIKQCLENNKGTEISYKAEIINLNDETSIFPEEIIKTSDTDSQKKFDQQDLEDTFNFQSNTVNNESSKDPEIIETSAPDPNQKSWKSGRISKYSQKPLKHTCVTCGKKWRTSTELKTHMKSHSNLRPYMCEKCGQAYKHKHALEIHVGMHNGISPFRCSHCDKCFTQKGALQRHLPMHTGETPYQCELCGKRFVHHTSYNMHALSHTGKKSYRCHVCDLSLLSTSHLKRHMRVHTGEKPYSCDFCGKSFAERYNLLAHQKIHDPVQISAKETKKSQYKCNQCEASFAKKQNFEDHKKQHASESKQEDNWTGHNNVEDETATVKESYAVNGADLLESCVNEVWQSLTKNAERLKS